MELKKDSKEELRLVPSHFDGIFVVIDQDSSNPGIPTKEIRIKSLPPNISKKLVESDLTVLFDYEALERRTTVKEGVYFSFKAREQEAREQEYNSGPGTVVDEFDPHYS